MDIFSNKLSKLSGLLGNKEEIITPQKLSALKDDILHLEIELERAHEWYNLNATDSECSFSNIITEMLEDVKGQYTNAMTEDLIKLQTQEKLLKGLLYAYNNASNLKESIAKQLNEKRGLYGKQNSKKFGQVL